VAPRARLDSGRRADSRRRPRRGVALVAVLAVLAIASGLVAGAFLSAAAAARAARATRAVAYADAASHRALAMLAAAQGDGGESLPVGASRELAFPAVAGDSSLPIGGHASLRRLSATVYVLIVDASVGEGRALLARRRYQLLLERTSDGPGTGGAWTLAAIPRWSVVELW
jgi:hypothetical protein